MIILTGYEAPCSRRAALAKRGRLLPAHGQALPLREETVQFQRASAPADASQLMAWLSTLPHRPQQFLIVLGDPETSDAEHLRIE